MDNVKRQISDVKGKKYKVIFYFLVTFCFVVLFQQVSVAQEITASVNETLVADNERFQISFTFSGPSINNLSKLSPPSFENFLILSGPNQSTSIQIINGTQSASLTYTYLVQPKGIGTFTIGSAGISQGGNVYESDPIKITVVKGTDKPKQPKDDPQIYFDEIAKNLFIRASVDKSRVYSGESIILTYKLYRKLDIGQLSPTKMPQYQGFWAEQLDVGNNTFQYKKETFEGKQFLVGELMKVALFPTQTGTLQVTPLEIKIPVAIQKQKSKNIWDDFFGDPFGRTEAIDFNAKSNVVKIQVDPLPPGQPDSFKGAVGDYSLDVKLNNTTVKSNEPLTLNINISGTGNINLIEMPEINLPNGFEKYEPKVNDKINRKAKISGSKTGEYLFVPRVVGIREIPPIEFSYFDPSKKKYVTLKSRSFNIDIKPGDKLASTEVVGKEDVKELGTDIRFIKNSFGDISKKENYIINSTGFLLVSILPVILGIGLI
ncbi:MAG: BatD family protein, partial [Ignavibacteria bacterium]|nr:BatD family protein [Ignavibacteria bacterium]